MSRLIFSKDPRKQIGMNGSTKGDPAKSLPMQHGLPQRSKSRRKIPVQVQHREVDIKVLFVSTSKGTNQK
jgi:hypothetical protein